MDADVVVIGAGAAGLAAAWNLAKRSFRVSLLEARDRTGGRVWPVDFGDLAAPAELGAEFIHGDATTTMGMLRDAGLSAVATGGDAWVRDAEGKLHHDEDFLSSAEIFESVAALESDESVDNFLARFQDRTTMRETVARARAFVEGFDAADPAIASAKAIAQEWRSGVDSKSSRLRGGYGPLFEYLNSACAGAGVTTHLSTVVRRMLWRNGAVALDVEQTGGKTGTIHARAAIVTVPVGVLRRLPSENGVAFEPELPSAKRAALEKVVMGDVVKVTLRFRTSFWQELCGGRYRDAGFFRYPAHSIPTYWTQFPKSSRLIVAWAAGPRVIALSELSYDELIARALEGFGALFGEPALATSEFEAALFHDWKSDPYSCGAYSYVVAGGADGRATLALPIENTVFFAGEATSLDGQGGTVNGAFESGLNAARDVVVALQGKNKTVTDPAGSVLTPWSNFYVMMGSSAAALTGLMFIVITLVMGSERLSKNGEGISVFSTPTVMHFGAALLVSAMLSAPWRSLVQPVILLGLLGLVGCGFVLLLMFRARRLTGYRADFEDWTWYTVLPFLAYATVVVGAALLWSVPHNGMFGVAAGVALLVFIGLRNAWDIVTYIVIQDSQ